MKEVIFITPVANDTRINKRINEFEKNHYKVKILSFERDFYKGEKKEFISLGKIENGKYLKRIFLYLKILKKVKKEIKKNELIYCFELDNLVLGYISTLGKKNELIYEVADIREVFFKTNIIGKFFRKVQKFLMKRIKLIVVTSKDYINGYFNRVLGLDNFDYCVIENKPVLTVEKKDSFILKSNKNQIKIGYFGVLRCQRSWDILVKTAKQFPKDVEIYVRGYPLNIKGFENNIKNNKNIKYDGTYKSDDLPEIYNIVDIVWGCYPYSDKKNGNWKLARTNRFYEAAYFNKPMFLQKGTADNKIGEKYGISIQVDMNDINKTLKKVEQINMNKLKKIKLNYKKLPKEIYEYTNEYEILFKKLGG